MIASVYWSGELRTLAQQRVRGVGEGRQELAAGGLPADSDLDVRIATIWQ